MNSSWPIVNMIPIEDNYSETLISSNSSTYTNSHTCILIKCFFLTRVQKRVFLGILEKNFYSGIMKFSIITPTMNDAEIIVRTINSIKEQDYSKDLIEWILIDCKSSDSTLNTIKDQSLHPDKWESEKNNGFFDSLNRGFKKATGDVICFLPAGYQLANRGSLFRISSAFLNSGASCVYSNMEIGKFKRYQFTQRNTIRPGIYKRWKLNWGWCPPIPTICMNRETMEKTALPSGDIFGEEFADVAGIEWVYRTIGCYKVEPAYLRLVTMRCSTRARRVSGRNLWKVVKTSNKAHLGSWIGLRFRY